MINLKWRSSDEEKRKLVIHIKSLKNSLNKKNNKIESLIKRVKEQNKEIRRLKKENSELKETIEKLRSTIDRYNSIIFKRSKKSKKAETKEGEVPKEVIESKKVGAKKGHKGSGRKKPEKIDEYKEVFIRRCPFCDNLLSLNNSYYEHIVEDIPSFEYLRYKVILYKIMRQWCSKCKKEVVGIPSEVIPKSRLGINTLLYVMNLRYGMRSSLDSIVESIKILFGLKVSKAGVVNLLHKASKWLGSYYEKIKEEIKSSVYSCADETSWRINGNNCWVWSFSIPKAVYYMITNSRGKAIPHNFYRGSPEDFVIVRDDYYAYRNIKMKHQSCWAHLLRACREEAERESASDEVIKLYAMLKDMYSKLSEIIKKPFDKEERIDYYNQFIQAINDIINYSYKYKDAKRIQKRIDKQNVNLLTALLYENVPLTNNLAERTLRPIVVSRKISGGSRSNKGSYIHAVNMSVFQTLKMKNLSTISDLKNIILNK